jgi:hypothetical protein
MSALTSVGVAIGQNASRAWAEISRPSGAPAPTVEALMFSLRRGVQALREPDALCRLSQLDDAQAREIAIRLQNFQPHIAPAWAPNEVKALVVIWSRRHVVP